MTRPVFVHERCGLLNDSLQCNRYQPRREQVGVIETVASSAARLYCMDVEPLIARHSVFSTLYPILSSFTHQLPSSPLAAALSAVLDVMALPRVPMSCTVMIVALNFLLALYAFMAVLKWLKSCSPALVCPCATHGCCNNCTGIGRSERTKDRGGRNQFWVRREGFRVFLGGCAFLECLG